MINHHEVAEEPFTPVNQKIIKSTFSLFKNV